MSVKVPLKASLTLREEEQGKGRRSGIVIGRINLSCIHYSNVLFHLLPVFASRKIFSFFFSPFLSDLTWLGRYETLNSWHAQSRDSDHDRASFSTNIILIVDEVLIGLNGWMNQVYIQIKIMECLRYATVDPYAMPLSASHESIRAKLLDAMLDRQTMTHSGVNITMINYCFPSAERWLMIIDGSFWCL